MTRTVYYTATTLDGFVADPGETLDWLLSRETDPKGPLGYEEFIQLLSEAWLIVSDSGGVQEEAPTLGRPLLILRENTERPEAVASGVARLVGGSPERLANLLEEAYREESWANRIGEVSNPFGDGQSGRRISETILAVLGAGKETSVVAASTLFSR